MRKVCIMGWFWFLAATLLLGGCGAGTSSGDPHKRTVATPKRICWVQPLKGHPVHQLTQIAFAEGCKDLGYRAEIVGTDTVDIGGTIALAEQMLASGDVAGMVIWTGNPAWNPLIERVAKRGIPVILPHFPVPEGSVPGATGIIGCDPLAYARETAGEIGRALGGTGTVAITQGSFNSTENMVATSFTQEMKKRYPGIVVLDPQEEGFDAPKAISKAVSMLQANQNVVAAFSTTGGGPTTWAGAQKETGRKIVAVGLDYTRVNLDLVKGGQLFAVIGQPLWEEAYGSVGLVDKVLKGEKIPWWTKLPAPFIKKDKVDSYYILLDKVEAALKR